MGTGRWLTLIGMGDDGLAGLPRRTAALVQQADIIVGSRRLLTLLPDTIAGERELWPSPFAPLADRLRQERGRRVVVLTTGDPLWYGAGVTLLRHFEPGELDIHPHVSAFSLAAARMGWPLHEIGTVSLHGRPLARLNRHLVPGTRLIVITSAGHSVRDIAALMRERGFGQSRMTVLEHMGGAQEQHFSFTADAVGDQFFANFHTVAIELKAAPQARVFGPTPGLCDDAFHHDGQLTKREVRAASLAALAPYPGQHLWDIGAGSGAIAIEWMRAQNNTSASAFERDQARCDMIRENATNLGVPEIEIHAGCFPELDIELRNPNAIFWGGSVSDNTIFEAAWPRLEPGGRLVANAVTLEAEQMLFSLQAEHGGELVRLQIEHLSQLGSYRVMRPSMPVTQWRITKEQ